MSLCGGQKSAYRRSHPSQTIWCTFWVIHVRTHRKEHLSC